MSGRCVDCRWFASDAAAFERALPGIRPLSSALAAVRGDDGLCRLHDRIVRPSATCPAFDFAQAGAYPGRE